MRTWLNLRLKQLESRRFQLVSAWVLFVVSTLAYAVVMSYESLLRYLTFKATAFDLGNMDQVVWNTLHGRFFQFTNQAIDWFGPPTRLGFHVEPILIPMSLLYLIYSDPRTLLIFQTLVLASGTVPVFFLTRKHLPDWPLLAAFMVGAYCFLPGLLGLNVFDFHPVCLVVPMFLYGMLALESKHYGWFVLTCILACACKEDMPLAVAMLGILVIWKYRLPRLGLALFVGGLLWAYIDFGIVIPHFSGVQHNNFWYRYEALGSTPTAAIINILIHPWLLITTFMTLERLYYLASLCRSTGFLAILAPEWLLPALPSLAVNLLSTDSSLYSGLYHYNAAIIPFIMLSSIYGTKRLIHLWQYWRGEEREPLEAEIPAGTEPHPFLLLMYGISRRLNRLSFGYLGRLVLWLGGRLQLPKGLRIWLSGRWTLLQQRIGVSVKMGNIYQFNQRMAPIAKAVSIMRLQWVVSVWFVAMSAINFIVILPSYKSFLADHFPGPHEQHVEQLLSMIPPNASVSASSNLNPHLSERERLEVFPSPMVNDSVQYVIIDLNSVFPEDRGETTRQYNQLLSSGQFRLLARAEGVVLLVRNSS